MGFKIYNFDICTTSITRTFTSLIVYQSQRAGLRDTHAISKLLASSHADIWRVYYLVSELATTREMSAFRQALA